MERVIITPLASGSSGNAYHVTQGGASLLLECGLTYKQIKKGLGFNAGGLCGCLVSHEHMDHARAVGLLAARGIDIYASGGTLEALGVKHHRLHTIKAMKQFMVGPWRVLPFETRHDATEPLGFLIAGGDEKLLYVTDSCYVRYRFAGLTHIMIECNYAGDILAENVKAGDIHPALRRRIARSHMSLETVKEMLLANDLSRVGEIWLLHLSCDNSDGRRFKREVEEITGKPTYIC